jgi:hypothetical protein
MKSMKMLLSSTALIALSACGTPMTPSSDGGGGGGNDAATSADGSTSRTDSGSVRRDAGMMSSDRCSASQAMATSTVGCNGGFVSGMPAPNSAGGTCTGGGMEMPMGTCMANMLCTANAMMMGICLPTCTPGSTYVSTGGCPMGFRCFDLDGAGLCFRDCDATHPCPTGQMCDDEGSCVTAPMMMGKPN